MHRYRLYEAAHVHVTSQIETTPQIQQCHMSMTSTKDLLTCIKAHLRLRKRLNIELDVDLDEAGCSASQFVISDDCSSLTGVCSTQYADDKRRGIYWPCLLNPDLFN